MPKQVKYYDDLPAFDMIEQHDFTFCMSDDNRYYESGRRELQLINEAVEKEYGGWTKEVVDHWNKFAPHDDDMSWRKEYTAE